MLVEWPRAQRATWTAGCSGVDMVLLVPPPSGRRRGEGPNRLPDALRIVLAMAALVAVAASPWPGASARPVALPSPRQVVQDAFGQCLADGPYAQARLDVHLIGNLALGRPARYRITLRPKRSVLRTAVLVLDTGQRQLRPADPATAGLLSRSRCPAAFWPSTTGPS